MQSLTVFVVCKSPCDGCERKNALHVSTIDRVCPLLWQLRAKKEETRRNGNRSRLGPVEGSLFQPPSPLEASG